MKLIVTTGVKTTPAIIADAQDLATALTADFIARDHMSLENLRLKNQIDHILVVTKTQLKLIMPTGTYFFHIGMAKLRIQNLRIGKTDHMINAMQLTSGDVVLDCTLGLGTDAIVASYVLGSSGRVIGVESSPIVTELVCRGLVAYDPEDPEMALAMLRIEVVCAEHMDYLQRLPDKSVDIVYFDPMFRRPVQESSGIAPLRLLANPSPVTKDAIDEAKRVARKRVVFKEAAKSREFLRLGFQNCCGGTYSSVMFGYIETKEGE